MVASPSEEEGQLLHTQGPRVGALTVSRNKVDCKANIRQAAVRCLCYIVVVACHLLCSKAAAVVEQS